MDSKLFDPASGSPIQEMFVERPSRKTELIQYLRVRRGSWNSLLEAVGEEHMIQHGAEGHWSVKDVICHITAYEAWLVEWLSAAADDSFPGQSLLDDSDIKRRNARVYDLTRTLDLHEVMSEAHQTFIKLLKVIKSLPDRYFDDPQSAEWFMKPYWSRMKTVPEAVINLTVEHYEDHIPAIKAWIAKEPIYED